MSCIIDYDKYDATCRSNKGRHLFWDIINCPDSGKESDPNCPCYGVLSVQKNLPFRQVPEPWNGDLERASFILFGSNPALDVPDDVKSKAKNNSPVIVKWKEHEVFPSKDSLWKDWQVLSPSNCSSFKWTPDTVEDYFINRFNNSIFKPLGIPFVVAGKSTLRYAESSAKIYPHRLKNDYWQIYNRYCKALDSSFVPNSFVVTDFVHCKSGAEFGVIKAFEICKAFTNRILDLFINNGQPRHSILLIGANKSRTPKRLSLVLDALSHLGAISIGNPVSIGRNNNGGDIFVQHLQSKKGDIDVYYNIPAPSGQTRQSGFSPVTLFPGNQKEVSIKW